MSPMVRLPLTVELALLGFLRQRPMHGYEIYQTLAEPAGLGMVWRLKQSQLYALLGRLEAEGYIAGELEAQGSRPPRRVFHLTEAGQSAFLAWVRAPVPHGRDLRLEFLAKLYFARQEGDAVARALVVAQRGECEAWLARQQAQGGAVEASAPYHWLVHEFRVGQLEAMLAWLDRCEQVLLTPLPAE